MKKIILFAIFTIGISAASFSQIGQEQTAKKEGFFHRLFHMRDNRPRKQMHHFDAPKKDPNLKHNGTAFWRRKKKDSKYKVDGDGFSAPSGGKKFKNIPLSEIIGVDVIQKPPLNIYPQSHPECR